MTNEERNLIEYCDNKMERIQKRIPIGDGKIRINLEELWMGLKIRRDKVLEKYNLPTDQSIDITIKK